MRSLSFWLVVSACTFAFAMAVKVTPEDADKFAAAGHPMFVREPPKDLLDAAEGIDEDLLDRVHGNDRLLQGGGCTQRTVAVYESEYDVDYKDGDFQIGVTPLYRPDNLNEAMGKWWWDWAVFRGTNGAMEYGTMMIEYNGKESITFGFSESQSYWPISGGYLSFTACPGGYSYFIRQDGDIRYYMLYICSGC